MIEADDKGISREVREAATAYGAVKRDLFSVADAPIVRRLAGGRDFGNGVPVVIIKHVVDEREGYRVVCARRDVDRAGGRLAALRGRHCPRAGLGDCEYCRAGRSLLVARSALGARYRRAARRGDGDGGREVCKRDGIALDDVYGLCARCLAVQRGRDRPRTGLGEGEHTLPVDGRTAHAAAALAGSDERAGRHGDDERKLHAAGFPRVCIAPHITSPPFCTRL